MNPLNLKIKDQIEIDKCKFAVEEIIDRKVSENGDEKSFFSYHLSCKDPNITHAEIDYFSEKEIIFHVTKKIASEISDDFVEIEGSKYSIIKTEDEFYIDPYTKEIKDVKVLKLIGCREGITPQELHLLDEYELFYLNYKIKKEEIKNA